MEILPAAWRSVFLQITLVTHLSLLEVTEWWLQLRLRRGFGFGRKSSYHFGYGRNFGVVSAFFGEVHCGILRTCPHLVFRPSNVIYVHWGLLYDNDSISVVSIVQSDSHNSVRRAKFSNKIDLHWVRTVRVTPVFSCLLVGGTLIYVNIRSEVFHNQSMHVLPNLLRKSSLCW